MNKDKLFRKSDTNHKMVQNFNVKSELVSYQPEPEVQGAIEDFKKKIWEAFEVDPSDWPKGRTVKFTIKFTVFPSSITTEFGQE